MEIVDIENPDLPVFSVSNGNQLKKKTNGKQPTVKSLKHVYSLTALKVSREG
jgi:hypothetical protein